MKQRAVQMGKRAAEARTLDHDEARRFYDRFGAWQDTQGFYERPAIERLIAHAGFGDARAVVEFGCGTGRFAAELLSSHVSTECRYLGLDVSSTMVSLARERVATFGVRAEVRQTDGAPRFDCDDESCDRVVSTYVLDLLPADEISALLVDARRILVAGGLFGATSLTRGERRSERVVASLLKRIHAVRPALLGGCRPIDIESALREEGWRICFRCVVSPFAIPSEVVIAQRP